MSDQIFIYPPNWIEGVDVKYSFNTSIFTSEHYKEQRKPLRSWPLFEMSYNILTGDRYLAPQIINFLRANLSTIFYVPIWVEPIQNFTDFTYQELSAVATTEDDLLKKFCLCNLIDYVICFDVNYNREPQVMSVLTSGITEHTIEMQFSSPYQWTDIAGTIIYPAKQMILDSFDKASLTPSFEEIPVSFKEYVTGLSRES